MRADHLNAFADACIAVIHALFGSRGERGALGVRDDIAPAHAVNLSCQVGGDLEGAVLFGISAPAADRIAAKIHGTPVLAMDAEGFAAIAEFGRMVGSHSLELLAALGCDCALSEPIVSRGRSSASSARSENVADSGALHALCLPIAFNGLGSIHVAAALSDHRRRVA